MQNSYMVHDFLSFVISVI